MRPALLAGLCAAHLAAGLAPEPSAVTAEAARWASTTGHYAWQIVGHSRRGRPIGMLLATARPEALHQQLRLMVLARQHGDESSPANAALLWMRTNAVSPVPFRDVAVLLVPTVNPDGAAAGRRTNGAGVDLNRDWLALSQPETRLVDGLIREWQPHVLVDLHEFDGLQQGRRREEDWVEILQTGRPDEDQTAQWLLHELVASQQRVGEPVRSLTVPPGTTAETLCHRAVALRHHLPALLIEVGDQRADPGARAVNSVVDLLAQRHEVLKPRLDTLRGIGGWTPPDGWFAQPAPPPAPAAPPEPPAQPPPTPWPVAIGFATILLTLAKFRAEPADS